MRAINALLRKALKVEIRRVNEDAPVAFSIGRQRWNYTLSGEGWIGGKFEATNYSHGYHGILRQWWDHYNQGSSCLLVSENNVVKAEFESHYPSWSFLTLDKYDNLGQPVDMVEDLCGDVSAETRNRFDLVICQATLEHVYDPCAAIRNMIAMLKENGVLVVHTHTPSFPYHPYPRDYLRFQLDWFQDIPEFAPGSELAELYAVGGHVFAAIRRIDNAANRQITRMTGQP